jgi:hypothetical protein
VLPGAALAQRFAGRRFAIDVADLQGRVPCGGTRGASRGEGVARRRDVCSRDERGASRDGRVFAPSSAAPTVGCGQ